MASIALRPTFPMFDPRTFPAYCVIAFGIALSAILVPLLGFHVSPSVWPILFVWPFVAFSGMLLRRIGHPKSATALEATALVYGQGFAFLLALFPLTAIGAPFADARLAAWDGALSFDWNAYAWRTAPFISPLTIAYKSFNWQPLVVIGLLVNNPERLWRFVSASTIALLITVVVYPMIPALGAFPFHHPANYPANGPMEAGRIIEYVRNHREIAPNLFTGFVAFPSYHSAASILFVWAAWPTKLRYPMMLLNLVVCLSIPVAGGHYFVDMLAGFGVAAVALYGPWLYVADK